VNFELSEVQRAISETARPLLAPRSPAQTGESRLPDPEKFLDLEAWRLLARAGLPEIVLADEGADAQGGSGLPALCSLLIEIGRSLTRVPALECLLAALAVRDYGTAAQRERLAPVASGEELLTLGITEELAYDPSELRASATRAPGGWRAVGHKTDIGYFAQADYALVPFATDGQVLLALVSAAGPGVTLRQLETSNNAPAYRVTFDDVFVPDEAAVGGGPLPAAVLARLCAHAAVATCALHAGAMQAALELTVTYTTTRHQFGRPLATFQLVAAQAADAHIAVEAAGLTMWEAAWRLASGLPAAAEVAVAKFWASSGAARVMTTVQHLHGGLGVDIDYPVHQYVRWSKALERSYGSPSTALDQLADCLSGAVPGGEE
jgi:3-oxocholest-4-en-26-oyl-CoA dehydrogenase beta subunit